ncbi:MAG: DUF6173 family protein [Desulfobacteria bacterium]
MASDELKKALEGIRNPLNDIVKGFVTPAMPELPKIQTPTDPNLASEFHKRLVEWINDFDKSLDQDHEVGVRLVNFGQSVTFHLRDIGYWNPSLISFSGYTEQGEPVELIQHVSQISILLLKVKRQDTSQPKRPIGFANWDEQSMGE